MRNRNHNGRTVTVLVAALVALVGTLCLTAAASAQTIYTWKYDGTYPASTYTIADALPPSGASPERPRNVHIDQANNTLYSSSYGFPAEFGEPPPNRFYKMNLAGKSAPFSAFEPNTWLQIPEMNGTYAVDNSGTASQGRVYYVDTLSSPRQLRALQPSGLPYTEGFPYVPADQDICGVAVDPEGDVWVSHFNNGVAFEGRPNGFLEEIDSTGKPTGEVIYTYGNSRGSGSEMCDLVIDADGEIYVTGVWASIKETSNSHGGIYKFASDGTKHKGSIDPAHQYNGNNVTKPIEIDRSTGEFFFSDGNTVRVYDAEGGYAGSFGQAEGAYPGFTSSNGMAIDEDTHKIYVGREGCCGNPSRIDRFARQAGVTVPDVRTTDVATTTNAAEINGTVNADGTATTDCYFEWGALFPENNGPLANKADCVLGVTPTDVFTGNSTNQVHAEIGGLVKGTMYHFRLVSKNANDVLSRGIMRSFRASGKPVVANVSASNIDTGGAILSADLSTNGSETRYRFEWGTEAGNYTDSAPAQPDDLDWEWFRSPPKGFAESLTGLQSETTYHFRFVAENDAGTTATADQTFRTFAKDPEGDECPNAHVRQQTSTRLLLDCRAYELVSAGYAGGYDVESDLVPGQAPLVSPPGASGRALFSYRFGSVPGIAGSPTTFGHDPYVATRGSGGWETRYAGLPADGMTDQTPYGSPLLGYDSNLTTFAFGGADICNPCFSDGSINIPLRRPDGLIEKGIPGGASANPGGGLVHKYISDNGSHLVFATKEVLATGGSPTGSIYDRNLDTGAVQLVSRLDNGTPMPGGQAAVLDVSDDGSRIVVAVPTGTDSNGNTYWHPYLHVGTGADTVDLAPLASDGVLFAGMSADGTRVYMATHDELLPLADTDNSADIYEALVPGSGPATLSLVSVKGGSPVNSDACNPPDDWNAVGDEARCSALPFAGGAGVSADGTIYFLSPEKLGAGGEEQDQPNVYRRKPGEAPQYVATPDTSVGKPPPPPPGRPVENAVFASGLTSPEGLTVDTSNGNLYVVETSGGSVSRYSSTGTPVEFSATGNNKISGLSLASNSVRGVAVDDSASPFDGAIYVNDGLKVSVFSQTGTKLGEITGSTGPSGSFKAPCGVAVSSAGVVYIADKDGANGLIYRYVPTGAAPITDADYGVPSVASIAGDTPCPLAVDSLGNVFYAQAGGPVRKVTVGQFGTPSAVATPTTVGPAGTGLAIDRSNNELFVSEGSQFSVYEPGGTAAISSYGLGTLTNARGIAVDPATHKSYTPKGSNVIKWGYEPADATLIVDPAVVNALTQSEVHSYSDFQVSSDGRYAAFSSARSLTGYPINGKTALYRFDSQGGGVDCVSCPVSEINATADTTLPPYGQGLDDQGRVFFSTDEQLVLRDTNNVGDVYEWKENGSEPARQQQLISAGSSPVPSSLLGISQDGVDAFFFTRDVLTEEDRNGGAIKLYTARENGGFPYLPPPVPCQAADECRGAGTPQPGAPNINTFTGGGPGRGNAGKSAGKKCRKGQVKRRGKNGKVRCVKKKKNKARRG
jgi:sugar lactone lactonase YvrE